MADPVPTIEPLPPGEFADVTQTARDLVLRGAGVPAEILEASSAEGGMHASHQAALGQFLATLGRRLLPHGPLEEELPPLPPLPRRNPNAKTARR